jgi:hypothetical protein
MADWIIIAFFTLNLKLGPDPKKSFCIYKTGFKEKRGLFVMGHLGGSASTLNISKTLIYIWDGFKP